MLVRRNGTGDEYLSIEYTYEYEENLLFKQKREETTDCK